MGPNINTTQPQETSQSSPFSITKESLLEPFRHLNNISNGGKFITAKLYQNSFIIFFLIIFTAKFFPVEF